MDLEKLNAIDTTKADEVKALQSFLKTRGYYNGPIDGKWGGGTTEGAGKLRGDFEKAKAADVELETTRTKGKIADAEGKKAENDPTARLTKMGTELAPYAVGIGTGTAMGHLGFSKPYAAADKKAGEGTSRLAKALDIDPKVKEDQLNRGTSARRLRNTAQFAAPAVLGGAGYATREYIAPMFSDPQTQDIVRGVGTGENAAAMTLGVHQLIDTLRRGNPNDPVDEARIRSGARGPGTLARALAGSRSAPSAQAALPAAIADVSPDAPAEPSGPRPGTLKHMQAQARALGIKGVSGMNKGPLSEALSKAMSEHGAKRTVGPRSKSGGTGAGIAALVGGGVAADAAYNDARASGASPVEAVGSAAPAAAVTAGGAYGAGKLAQMLGPMAGKAVTAAGVGKMAYDNASEAQGYREPMSPEQRGGIPGALAHAMPLAMRGASDIASIQSAPGRLRDALSSAMTPGNAQPEEYQGSVYPEAVPPQQAQPEPFATARALQIPGNIPPNAARDAETAAMQQQQAAPQPQAPMMQAQALQAPEGIPENAAADAEMAARFSPGIEQRLQRMISLNAPPEAVAAFLNQAIR